MSVQARQLASGIVALALGCVAACSSEPAPGSIGLLRYAGRVKGLTPLAVLPPVSDPAGNIYVLNGSLAIPETNAFVGAAGGGWKASCSRTKGDAIGAHGWTGYAQDRQWYWSGFALVQVSGRTGDCRAVLDRDPATNADLFFQAVIPAVRNRSQRTSVPALVQSPTDPVPFTALVDLDAEILTNVRPFDPPDAKDVQVIGVGGLRERERGVILVQYRQGSRAFLELRGYTGDADLESRIAIGGGPYAAYAVPGYLQLDDTDLVAGLIQPAEADGAPMLLTADANRGDVKPVSGMEPVGVHRWDGALWLVGTRGDAPAIAPISRGGIGAVVRWESSEVAASAFGGSTTVRDDRSLPSRETSWTNVRTAAGPYPFVSPHSPVQHAPGTTLWAFAGPAITDSALRLTSFAVAPCGLAYP